MSDTLYGKIVSDLVEKIEKGLLPMGSKMPTETELAQEYFVSRITSRRALNELAQSGYVTRKRRAGTFVIRNSLRGASPPPGTRVIGLVFPFTSFTLDGQNCLNGVMEVSNRFNYYTVVKNSLANYRIERQIIEKYIADQIDGIIYYPVDSESNFLQIAALQACHCPIVTIDKTIDGTDISSVTSDNWQGSLDAMRHLVNLGHKNIAFFADALIKNCSSLRQRFSGYLHTLAVNGLVYNPKLVFCLKPMVFDEPGVIPQESMQRRISAYTHKLTACLQEGATAVLCGSDGTAYWVCKACEQLDLKIPRDISLCAFDGQHELPSLQMSTASQDLYTIGKRAAEMLVEAIDCKVKTVRHDKVPVNFVARQSARRLLLGETAPQPHVIVTQE